MITVQHPYRFPIQALVSTGQIYGLILYYATSLFDLYFKDISYSRPEAYYFWFYFFFVNFIWMVIPGCTFNLPVLVESADFFRPTLSKRRKNWRCFPSPRQHVQHSVGQRRPQSISQEVAGEREWKDPKEDCMIKTSDEDGFYRIALSSGGR